MTNLIYVCHYNIERSPLAEQITRQVIEEQGINGLTVSSAGLIKLLDYPRTGMNVETIRAAEKRGHKIYQHTPKQVTAEMLEQQDIVACFSEREAEKITEIAPRLEGKVLTPADFSLGRIIPPSARIRDIRWWVRRSEYEKGYVQKGDMNGIMSVHTDTIIRIEDYVEKVLQRILLEKT